MTMRTVDLSGIWECSIPGQSGEIRLPGTLDEGGFGLRRYSFEGQAKFSRKVSWGCSADCRVFLECERAR